MSPKAIVQQMLDHDLFSQWLDINVDEILEGKCTISMKVEEQMTTLLLYSDALKNPKWILDRQTLRLNFWNLPSLMDGYPCYIQTKEEQVRDIIEFIDKIKANNLI